MFDAVGQKAFLAHDSHLDKRTANASRQKFVAQASQGWRIRAAKEIGRDGEVKLIDQILFEQGAEAHPGRK